MPGNWLRALPLGLVGLRGGIVALQLAASLVAAVLLPAGEFGLFAVLLSTSRFAASALGLGVPAFLLKEMPWRDQREEPPLSRLFVLAISLLAPMLLTLLAAAAAVLASHLALITLLQRDMTLVALGFGLVWHVVLALGVLYRLRRGENAGMAVSDGLPLAVLLAALGIAVADGRPSALHAFLVATGLLAALALVLALVIRSPADNRGGRHADPSVRALGAYWGNALLSTLSAQVDVPAAALVLSAPDVGAYAILRRVSSAISMPQIIAVWATAPAIARGFAAGDRQAVQAQARRGMVLSMPLALLIAVGILASAPVWFGWFKLEAAQPVILAGLILLGANLFNMAAGPTVLYAMQAGQAQLSLRSRLAASIAGPLLVVLLALAAGLPGVALAQVAIIALVNLPIWWVMRRRHGVETSARALLIRPDRSGEGKGD